MFCDGLSGVSLGSDLGRRPQSEVLFMWRQIEGLSCATSLLLLALTPRGGRLCRQEVPLPAQPPTVLSGGKSRHSPDLGHVSGGGRHKRLGILLHGGFGTLVSSLCLFTCSIPFLIGEAPWACISS